MQLKKVFCLLLSLSSLLTTIKGQQVSIFAGSWEGKLNVGMELRVVFHIKEEKGVFSSTVDSPDQDAFGIGTDATTVSGNDIKIEMGDLKAVFEGKMVNDSTIEGEFTQGVALPLTLTRTTKVQKAPLRPQLPVPPFPYKSEDVTYTNTDKTITFGATITIPEGKGPFPAVLLITGSGPQDRDESLMGHKPFAVLADHLTRKGFVVLRTDDRGTNKSTGDFNKATSADFAEDAEAGVNYLISRTETDPKKVGLIGHSEGGMIAPMVAAKRKDIGFIVLMAGPGVPVIELMAEQNAAILRSGGVDTDAANGIKDAFKTLAQHIISAPTKEEALAGSVKITEDWAARQSPQMLKDLELETPEKRKVYVTQMVISFQTPWFQYFMKFNPEIYLEKLSCKILAINGSEDVQVISSQNLPGIEKSLKKSKSKNYEIKELAGLNHLFQRCNTCTVEEYSKLEETMAPEALDTISNWLLKNVK
ncbi:MAG: alpha/beta fold hydrolase [Chitinophagaceae bacterium]|nr:alpha/beta fold hydrolase [Chitinophagaceae bacterium]